MANIAKFVRTDGIEFEAEVGSYSFEMMSTNGTFTRIATEEESADFTPPIEPNDDDAEVTPIDLSRLKRDDLISVAATHGIEFDSENKEHTRAVIIAAIEEIQKSDAAGTVDSSQ